MDITTAQRQADGSILAMIGGVEMLIPPDPENTDFQAVEAWIAEGGEVEEAEPGTGGGSPGGPIGLPTISDRQFFQALALAPYSIITPQEALDAVKTGEIPAVMQAVIDELPADQQFAATMLIAGGTEYQRGNPLVEVFGASQGMDAAAIDAFWSFAGSL